MKKIFFMVLLLIIVIGAIAAFVLLNRTNKPLSEAEKQAALSKILGRPVITQEKLIPTGNTLHKGKYVSFTYPAAAEIFAPLVDGAPMKTGNLEDFDLDLGNPRIHLVSSVANVSSSILKLEDYPGVRLRQDEPTIYTQSKITAGAVDGLLFVKKDFDGLEKTTFFLINGKIFIFSFQGAEAKRVEALYDQVLSTIKFL